MPRAGRLTNVNQHHRPALASLGHVLALGSQGIPGEMQRVAIGRIASPVDDEIGAIFHLTQGTRDFTTQLGGYFGRAVSQGGVAVDHASNPLGQGDGVALRLAGDIAEPVYQRHVRLVEIFGRHLHRLVNRGRLAIDQGIGIAVFSGMVLEPRLAETTGALGLDDAVAFSLQVYVVTDAAAEGTGGVFYRFKGHAFYSVSLSPEPDGMMKLQPSARPRKLPRIRLGM